MWFPGLTNRNRKLDEIVAIASYEDAFLRCAICQLLPVVEIPPAYLVNTHDIETVTASDFCSEGIHILIQQK